MKAKESELDCFKLYTEQIPKRLLTFEEEKALCRRAKNGDKRARDEMVTHNLRLVLKIARPYAKYGVPMEDLVQEGNLALLKIIDKYDPERGFRFSTFADIWLKQAMSRAVMSQNRSIRLPVNVHDRLRALKKANIKLESELDRRATAEELAKEMNLAPEDIEAMFIMQTEIKSLHAPTGDGENTLSDVIQDTKEAQPSYQTEQLDRKAKLERACMSLPERDRLVLEMHFGLAGRRAHTLKEIAQELQISRERARQLEQRAMLTLAEANPGFRSLL